MTDAIVMSLYLMWLLDKLQTLVLIKIDMNVDFIY